MYSIQGKWQQHLRLQAAPSEAELCFLKPASAQAQSTADTSQRITMSCDTGLITAAHEYHLHCLHLHSLQCV